MIRNKRLLLALAFSASTALAQPPEPPAGDQQNPPPGQGGQQGHREHRPPPPIIAALDLDGDGIISADEIDKAPESLKKLDKNSDGQLTPDELHPPRPDGGPKGPGNGKGGPQGGGPRKGSGGGKGPSQNGGPAEPQAGGPGGSGQDGPQGGKRPVPPIIAALDTNGDGIISADEIANASASLRKLDKNGDGQLTPDEYRPQPPKRDGQKDGGPGNNGNGNPAGDTKKRPPAE